MPAVAEQARTLTLVDQSVVMRSGLHKHWRSIACTDEFMFGEARFLQILMHRYPDLLDIAVGKECSRNGQFWTNSVNYAELEDVCFHWRLYMYGKEVPGIVAPPCSVKMFEAEE